MKAKSIVKHIIDLCISVTLLFLMARQVTGEKMHEWLGVGMFVLVVAHNLLNMKWYAVLFKGRYTFLRIIRTAINVLLFAAMLAVTVSGILMNSYVLPLGISGTLATARVMHLACSYWCFVLVSVHLGLHWSIVTGFADRRIKGKGAKKAVTLVMRIISVAIAAYGAYCFISSDIFTYMTFQAHFAFLDYERQSMLVICDQLAMMGFWVFLSYYFSKTVQYLSAVKKEKTQGERP